MVRELDGVAAADLRGALLEMAAVGAGARTQRPLYHASINTARDELMTDAQKARAVERLADELGFTGQPHVIVEHVKAGREHLHVVWSRIDGETLKAIPDSHNYRRHELVARELELEFAHQPVQGAHVGREGERPPRTPEPYEMMQAARSNMTSEDAKAALTGLWQSTDSGPAFVAAIEDAGWKLARGDRRDFVVVDPYGETHSLGRRIDGVKAKDIRDRMANIDTAEVPTVDQARQAIRDRQAARIEDVPQAVPVQETHAAAEQNPPSPSPEERRRQWAAELRALDTVTQTTSEATNQPDRAGERPAMASPAEGSPPAQKPLTTQTDRAEMSRLQQVIDRARMRLEALGSRLEAAFTRVKEALHLKKPEPSDRPNVQKPSAESPDEIKAREDRAQQERGKRLAQELMQKWQNQEKPKGFSP